jgi:hypothetical protein
MIADLGVWFGNRVLFAERSTSGAGPFRLELPIAG